MLGPAGTRVFSKRAVLRTTIGPQDARWNQRALGRGRELRPIGGWRPAVSAREAGSEGADALEAYGEADVRDSAVGRAKQRRCPFQAPGQEVCVRRLAERASEFAAEMCTRETRDAGKIVDLQGFDVASVGQVFRTQKVSGGRDKGHGRSIASGVNLTIRSSSCRLRSDSSLVS